MINNQGKQSYNEVERRQILVETVREFGRKEWFRDAVLYNSFPTNGEPTLELKVNYIPIFERKEIKDFALRYGLSDRFLVVDKNGRPSE